MLHALNGLGARDTAPPTAFYQALRWRTECRLGADGAWQTAIKTALSRVERDAQVRFLGFCATPDALCLLWLGAPLRAGRSASSQLAADSSLEMLAAISTLRQVARQVARALWLAGMIPSPCIRSVNGAFEPPSAPAPITDAGELVARLVALRALKRRYRTTLTPPDGRRERNSREQHQRQ